MPFSDDTILKLFLAIVGICGTAVVGHKVAGWNARNTAGSKLRAAFAPELALLRTTPSQVVTPLKRILGSPAEDVDKILLDAFHTRHAAAIEEYRSFVPVRDRTAYETAWREYYQSGDQITFVQYMVGDGSHELFCKRVDAIFCFTHPLPWWRLNIQEVGRATRQFASKFSTRFRSSSALFFQSFSIFSQLKTANPGVVGSSKYGKPYTPRPGARDPNTNRGQVRNVIKQAGKDGVTIDQMKATLPMISETSLRNHLSVLVKLREANRVNDRWVSTSTTALSTQKAER